MAKIKINARIPPELMQLKHKWETQTEFVTRAMKALRAQQVEGYGSDPIEHQLLVKMVKVFAESGIKMELTEKEINKVKELYKQ